VKEIAILGGEIDDFVSPRVKERMMANINKK
jgi:phosphopantetheine adenylyltransferase